MISRRMSIPAIFVFLATITFPATAWLQEPAMSAPNQETGTKEQNEAVPGSLSLPAQAVSAETAEAKRPSPEQSAAYLIKENDTLWDIAAAHYRDPFLWPLIWQANPSVKNPDLIYPGQQLVIPSLGPIERAISASQEPSPLQEKPAQEKAVAEQAPAQQPMQQAAVPSLFRREAIQSATSEPEAAAPPATKLILPEEKARPIADKFLMLSAGFISEEDSEDYIIGSTTDAEKSVFSHDESVYIAVHSRPGVKVGDQLLIFKSQYQVKHPVTKQFFGELYHVLGILQVTKVNKEGSTTATASIIKSFDAAEKGSMLMPYQEPALIYPTTPRPAKNLAGVILDVMDRRSINAQTNIIYLDKGKEDGVAPGDRFSVFADGGNGSGVSRVIGEVEVILVKQRTATAIVRKSVDTMSKGDRYISKN